MSELEPTRTYSNPTATEILRRMLDERGVEWWQKKRHTCWKVGKGQEVEMWRAWEAPDGSLTLKVDYIYDLTPEQAIAATLGSCNCSNNCTNSERPETCHIDLVGYNQREDRFQCRSCDWYMWFKRGTWPQFNYCPNCGRRVEQ